MRKPWTSTYSKKAAHASYSAAKGECPLRLGHLASGYGHSHPLWFGCGKPDMGSTLSYRSRFLYLLSDRDLAAMVADHSKRYFNFLCIRRHALSFVAT